MNMFNRLRLKLKRTFSHFEVTEDDASRQVFKRYGEFRWSHQLKTTIVVVGANNGIENDPYTKWILHFDWQAILIEPNPHTFVELKKYFGHEKNIYCVNKAVSDEPGYLTLFKIAFSDRRWATGLTSFSRDVLVKHIQSGYIEKMAQRYGDKLPSQIDQWIQRIEVPCDTIGGILKDAGIDKVDVLAVDVEGLDAVIVNNVLDTGRRPGVICWEHLYVKPEEKTVLTGRLETIGYSILTDTNNAVCYRRELHLAGVFEK